MNKKMIITGGCGFIGTNIVNYYHQLGYDILNIDINSPKNSDHQNFLKIDLCQYKELEQAILDYGPAIVIHLGARTDLDSNVLSDYNSNIDGVKNLIKVLAQLPNLERVIFTSSMLVCKPGHIPQNFEDYQPSTVYGESKVLTEKIIKSSNLEYTWCIVRPTSIWGPHFGEPYKRFFSIVMNGKYFHMGSRACKKTYGYIENFVYQIDQLVLAPAAEIHKKVLYLGDYEPYDISAWADEIAELCHLKIPKIPFVIFQIAAIFGDIFKKVGIRFPMTSFRLKNMTTNNIYDLTAIKSLAPKLPVTRKDGTLKTIDWLRKSKKTLPSNT